MNVLPAQGRYPHRLPGFDQRQEQTGHQHRLPVFQHDARLLETQYRRSQLRCRHHQRHLHAVRRKIFQQPAGAHFASSTVPTSFSSSFFDNRRSLISRTSSGSAAPLNTRSTNSCPMALITWLRGRMG